MDSLNKHFTESMQQCAGKPGLGCPELLESILRHFKQPGLGCCDHRRRCRPPVQYRNLTYILALRNHSELEAVAVLFQVAVKRSVNNKIQHGIQLAFLKMPGNLRETIPKFFLIQHFFNHYLGGSVLGILFTYADTPSNHSPWRQYRLQTV
jgi:hypothetical protein